MVEFGLKLEDNKVSQWSELYIQYEKLKLILKKYETSKKQYEELSAQKPEVAKLVVESYKRGDPTPFSSSASLVELTKKPSSSNSSLTKLETIPADKNLNENVELKVSNSNSDYGSVHNLDEIDKNNSPGLLKRLGVSDYYATKYEKNLRHLLKSLDEMELEFGDSLIADINRINRFYKDEVEELEAHILYLRESAQPSKEFHNHIGSEDSLSEVSEDKPTPLISSRKQSSVSPMIIAKKIAIWTKRISMEHDRKKSVAGHERISSIMVDPLITSDRLGDDESVNEETMKKIKEAESIQRALVEHYRTAKLLQNYVIMNYTGFVKIVKKHGKTVFKENKGKYYDEIMPSKICNEGKEVDILVNRMERLYAGWFCDNNLSEARAHMLIKKADTLDMDWSQLRLGYRMGMSAVLALWVCWDCVWGLYSHGKSTIGGRTAFPVFRGCAGLICLQWCWGISVWVWSRYRVNYIFLFDLDPSGIETPIGIFNEAVNNTLFFLVCTLLYYKAGAHSIPGSFPPGVFPLLLVVYTVCQLIFPFRSRVPMWNTIFKVVTAPVSSPTFFQGYVGDIFTSMVKIFQDLVWACFFVLSGDWRVSEDVKDTDLHWWSKAFWYSHILIPVVTLLPLWFRFNQCLRRYADTGTRWPQLPNACKYALSILVSLFGAFHPLNIMNTKVESNLFQGFWMFLFITSSLYSFSWDVFMDWGLGNKKYGFLAERLMYPKRSFYFIVIAIDIVLRFAWVLTLIPPQSGARFALPAYLSMVSMMLELFRRTLWGFLRLENEHRTNTSGYRRVDFVPLHFSTGHHHGYKLEQKRSGFSVLIEVAAVTCLVLVAAIVSVIAAQQAAERVTASGEL